MYRNSNLSCCQIPIDWMRLMSFVFNFEFLPCWQHHFIKYQHPYTLLHIDCTVTNQRDSSYDNKNHGVKGTIQVPSDPHEGKDVAKCPHLACMVSTQLKHISQIGSFYRILAGSNKTCTSIQTTFKPPHRDTCALFFGVKIPSISCGLTPLQVGNEALPTVPLVPGCFKNKTIETGGGIFGKNQRM